MKTLLPLLILSLALTGCIKKAVYFQSGPKAHGKLSINTITGSASIDVNGAYVYCSVPLETTPEGRSFTEGFEKFCDRSIAGIKEQE